MRRNCNLELRLVPPSPFLFSDHRRQETPSERMELTTMDGDTKEEKQQQQQLTIFYDGKVSICDVTELQARAIINLASEEMEEKWRKTPSSTLSSEPSSPSISPSVCSPGGLSMKRSLQRFLQKRKHRIQATSPYHR